MYLGEYIDDFLNKLVTPLSFLVRNGLAIKAIFVCCIGSLFYLTAVGCHRFPPAPFTVLTIWPWKWTFK